MPFSDAFKDKYVAPEISRFTHADILDLSEVSREQKYWLLNFILNTAVRADVDDVSKYVLVNFLRRTEAAFRDYAEARRRTLLYLNRSDPDLVAEYIRAIDHWEQFLSHAERAWTVLVRGRRILFADKRDGSVLQRLNYLYNQTKHLEGPFRTDPPDLSPGVIMPMWLRNDGLHSSGGQLTFEEVAKILRSLAKWADAAQDPLTMAEAIRASLTPDDELYDRIDLIV